MAQVCVLEGTSWHSLRFAVMVLKILGIDHELARSDDSHEFRSGLILIKMIFWLDSRPIPALAHHMSSTSHQGEMLCLE